MQDTLFQWIETTHTGTWGDVLDAGTGDSSLRWLSSLHPKSITAITAEPWRMKGLSQISPEARLILGQWTKPDLLEGETFDVLLADYLIGAVDGHAPYFQYRLIPRLRPLLRSGGSFYLIGMEPPPIDDGSEMAEIVRLRDACLLLGGRHCYREYPQGLVIDWLKENGFAVFAEKSWPNILGERFINGQLNVAKQSLAGFRNEYLRGSMQEAIEELRARALAKGPKRFGSDWAIAAKKI